MPTAGKVVHPAPFFTTKQKGTGLGLATFTLTQPAVRKKAAVLRAADVMQMIG